MLCYVCGEPLGTRLATIINFIVNSISIIVHHDLLLMIARIVVYSPACHSMAAVFIVITVVLIVHRSFKKRFVPVKPQEVKMKSTT